MTEPNRRTSIPASAEPAVTPREAAVSRRVQRRWWVFAALGSIGIVVLLGLVITARNGALGIDEHFLDELVEHRNPFWDVPSLVFNTIGAGIVGVFVVPIGVAMMFLIRRRPWAALYWTLAVGLSGGAVQIVKHLFGRARPLDILVVSDYGSFPSGHTANAATMAVVLGIVLRRVWVWIAGLVYTILMLLSRTYLGAHWLTDTIGGVLLGVGVAVVLWTPFANRLLREPRGVWLWQRTEKGTSVPISS